MAGSSYIFGGNTGVTPEELKRKRLIAASLQRRNSSPRNVPEGITAVGNALQGRIMSSKADRAEAEGRQGAMNAWENYQSTGEGLDSILSNPFTPPALQSIAAETYKKMHMPKSEEEIFDFEQKKKAAAIAEQKRAQEAELLQRFMVDAGLAKPSPTPVGPASQPPATGVEPPRLSPNSGGGAAPQTQLPPMVQNEQQVPFAGTPSPTMADVMGGRTQKVAPERVAVAQEEQKKHLEKTDPEIAAIDQSAPKSGPRAEMEALTRGWKQEALMRAFQEGKLENYTKYYREILDRNRDDTRALKTQYSNEDRIVSFNKIDMFYKRLTGAIETSLVAPGVSDLAIVTEFVKILDEDSIARESEVEGASQSAGLYEKALAFLNNAKTGGGDKLTRGGREMFLNVAKKIYEETYRDAVAINEKYSNIVRDNQTSPVDHVVDNIKMHPAPPGAPVRSILDVENGGGAVGNRRAARTGYGR